MNLIFQISSIYPKNTNNYLCPGIEIFKENPITGTGIKTYHRYCKNLKEKSL